MNKSLRSIYRVMIGRKPLGSKSKAVKKFIVICLSFSWFFMFSIIPLLLIADELLEGDFYETLMLSLLASAFGLVLSSDIMERLYRVNIKEKSLSEKDF